MRTAELGHEELLELDPDGGVIRFAGRRALLLDAVAMGLLRKYLADNFGLNATRAVLTQFGFAHGWRMFDAMQAALKWDEEEEWRHAGPRLFALEGLFRVDGGSQGFLSPEGGTLAASYEAEQHLLHFGRAETPVCWTICGLMSGYLSRGAGEEVFVLEDRCVGRGDATCRLVARPRADWGHDRAEDLHFFEQGHLKDNLEVALRRITESLKLTERKLHARRRKLIQQVKELPEPMGTVARSSTMARLVELTRRIAKVDSTVLITGESGVGKERIARLLHEESARVNGPFIAVNCGAIAETLLESELFGHARGAFTGATHDRPGLFEAASGGTLLLDEIGDVSPGMQVKLLRALQEREIRRVGENRNRPIDVRVVTATNRDLLQGVSSGGFRQDLYYRLKVVELRVPPLRERREDLLPLARLLLTEAAMRMKHPIPRLTPQAADQLLRYGWPGNVRELENVMERAAALARGNRVEMDDLPEEVRHALPAPVASAASARSLAEIEKDYIVAVLALSGGNQTRTAATLRIGSATLYRKLKSYGVTSDRATTES